MIEADRWVFAYGSLMWRPEQAFGRRCRAYLSDYRRGFCVYAVHNRGTPSRRGLVLGVVPQPGARVEGIAYRVSGDRWNEAYRSLVDREQAAGAYSEHWLTIALETGAAVRALVFVANSDRPTWAGYLTDSERLALISTATGKMGSNADYAIELEQELGSLGIVDGDLSNLVKQLRKLIPRRSDAHGSTIAQDQRHESTI